MNVCHIKHAITIIPASQVHFLTSRNFELPSSQLVTKLHKNRAQKIGRHVALLSGPTDRRLLSIRYTVPNSIKPGRTTGAALVWWSVYIAKPARQLGHAIQFYSITLFISLEIDSLRLYMARNMNKVLLTSVSLRVVAK